MTSLGAGCNLAPSVIAYLTEPAIRTSVNALLEVKVDSLPPGLALVELNDYFNARAAAEVTRHEYASNMCMLWRDVWGSRISYPWQAADLDQLTAEGYSTSAADIWYEGGFVAWHRHTEYNLYSLVGFSDDEFLIGISLEDKDEDLIGVDFGAFVRDQSGDYEGWHVARWACRPCDPGFDLNAVNLEAERALAHIKQLSTR